MSRSKREGPGEINAGSMADIAFLLLIFFLVTTTMDMDEGILRQLPPPTDEVDPPDVVDRNVFEVKVNKDDQLLVEGELMDISQLKDKAKDFYTNPRNSEELPELREITKAKVENQIQALKSKLANAKEGKQEIKKNLQKWENRKVAIDVLGSYKELPRSALISLRNDRSTSYDMYIQVQNELQSAVNELRDELVRNHPAFEGFNSYNELKPNTHPEHKKLVKAVRSVYPQRISEAEPIDVSEK